MNKKIIYFHIGKVKRGEAYAGRTKSDLPTEGSVEILV